MIEIVETREFSRWFDDLRDLRAQANIQARIDRLALDGTPGDVKPVREGVSEMRIDYGPGYRVYFVQHGSIVIVLLAGGDKNTQVRDIETALHLLREMKKEPKK
jgi:putative addiction module killer protein